MTDFTNTLFPNPHGTEDDRLILSPASANPHTGRKEEKITSSPLMIVSGGLVVTGVEENERDAIPDGILLYQNYPNPFNLSTTITFALPKASHVTLKVYDLLGREVVTLVNETLSQGTYERTFGAEGLASGVYFYRMDGFVQTRKLLLVR